LSIGDFYREEAEEGAFTSPPFIQQILEELLLHIPQTSICRVLDVGSGRGANLGVLSGYCATVVASDISLRILGASREGHRRAGFVAADVQSLPFKSGSFDVIVSTEVLEHVPDLSCAILESERILREGGYLVVSTPNYGNLIGAVKLYKDWKKKRRAWEPWGAHAGGMERFMTARTLDRALRKRFRILERRGVDYFQSWLFPLRPLRRWYGVFLLHRLGCIPVLRSMGMHQFILAAKRQ
jgi:2-polyprenyl-3-methyl-5-hydroxy-6-metoxy-1,4-benzoquinol methylase